LAGEGDQGRIHRPAWIQKDGDLDAIREEPGYKKLIADDRLFEKKADDGLPADK
jgi:hypothetical protein